MRRLGAWLVISTLSACGSAATSDGGVSVGANGKLTGSTLFGSWEHSGDVLGLALLSRLEGTAGAPWSGEVRDARGETLVSFSVPNSNADDWVENFWPVPAALGDSYSVVFTSDDSSLEVSGRLSPSSGLPLPEPKLSGDGQSVTWARVAGAAAYECVSGSAAAMRTTTPSCTASPNVATIVRAFNVDTHATIDVDKLPQSFDVSEARFSFAASSNYRARAIVGAIDYAPGSRGLAVLVSVQTSAGLAPAGDWAVTISGGALGSTGSLSGSQLAGTDRVALWTYDVPPEPATYEISLTGTESMSLTVEFDGVGSLPDVSGVSASQSGASAPRVTWNAVAGASSYGVSAWQRSTGARAYGLWTADTSATLPVDAFISGEQYDVYVEAVSASMMTGSEFPVALSISENTYQPVGFTAN